MAKTKNPKKLTEVILLNKPFSGGWLDDEGNIAHEIIDFLQTDDGHHYIYDAPHGNAPDIYVAGAEQPPRSGEKYKAKYLVLTGPAEVHYDKVENPATGKSTNKAKGCSFDIKYVIRLKRKLHFFPAASWWKFWKSGDGHLFSKEQKENVSPVVVELLKEFCSPDHAPSLEESVRELVHERLRNLRDARSASGIHLTTTQLARIADRTVEAWIAYNSARKNHEKLVKLTSGITYNGKTLEQIYATQPENECSLNVTYEADGMFRADPEAEASHVTCQSYVHQRCRGRLKNEGEDSVDYEAILGKIKKIATHKNRIDPKPVEWNETFSRMSIGEPFLEQIGLGENEQAFTNMLWLILRTRNGNMIKEFCQFVLPADSQEAIKSWHGVKVMREKNATEALPGDEEQEDGKTDKELFEAKQRRNKKGRMDVCAEAFNTRGELIQRVIIENKIDSGINGVDAEKNEAQLSTYYREWGKVPAGNEPICLVTAPKSNEEKIQSDIAKNDPSMGGKYLFVDYGRIADFIDAHKGMIPATEINPSFVDEIVRSFRAHSLSALDEYTWMVLRKTESIG